MPEKPIHGVFLYSLEPEACVPSQTASEASFPDDSMPPALKKLSGMPHQQLARVSMDQQRGAKRRYPVAADRQPTL